MALYPATRTTKLRYSSGFSCAASKTRLSTILNCQWKDPEATNARSSCANFPPPFRRLKQGAVHPLVDNDAIGEPLLMDLGKRRQDSRRSAAVHSIHGVRPSDSGNPSSRPSGVALQTLPRPTCALTEYSAPQNAPPRPLRCFSNSSANASVIPTARRSTQSSSFPNLGKRFIMNCRRYS